MAKKRPFHFLLILLGLLFSALSLLLGCSFSAESNNVRVQSPGYGSDDDPYNRQTYP
ncbi:MAG TPA: hypothetical protein VK041_02335 [Opitutales bacterium]|nr:hypothetical protein [Opitutales bacterium]